MAAARAVGSVAVRHLDGIGMRGDSLQTHENGPSQMPDWARWRLSALWFTGV